MQKNFITLIISIIIALIFISPVLACGPFLPTYYHTPDDLKNIRNLKIDFKTNYTDVDSRDQIIFEKLWAQYLYPLYRKMTNRPLSNDEKYLLYFDDYSIPTWKNTELSEAIKLWKNTRSKFADGDPEIDQYGNCFPAAFKKAVETLQNRQSVYTKEELQEWIKNQDAVFAQCGFNADKSFQDKVVFAATTKAISNESGDGFFAKIKIFLSKVWNFILNRQQIQTQSELKTTTNTKAIPVKYNGLLQQDFEYQQAALAYYSGQMEKAENFFTLISNNPTHPWGASAAYTLGLLYVNNSDYTKAEEQFKNIIANPKYSEFHEAATGMLDFILGQRDPFALFKKAENTLEASSNFAALKQAWTDYFYLWPYPYFTWSEGKQSDIELEKRIIAEGSDMSQWILVWQHYQPEYLELIKEKYKQNKTEPWLLTLARFLPTADVDYKNIEEKVGLLPKSSAAYWTANYYVIKKAIESGEIDKARKKIAKLPDKNLPVVLNNYIEDLKMQTASSLADLFKHSERRTYTIYGHAGYTTAIEDKIIATALMIDNKAKVIFETALPFKKQLALVLREDIFSPKQTEFLQLVTLVRAFLLKDYDSAREIALLLAKNNPELEKDLSRFIFTTSKEDKEFYAVVFILNYPGVGINIYDGAMINKTIESSVKNAGVYSRRDYKQIFDYWVERWDYCQPTRYVSADSGNSDDDKEIPVYTWRDDYNLDFAKNLITENDKETARQELDKIFQKAPANYFASVVLDYAKLHPRDTFIPEALHRVVLATRFVGCSDDETSSFSKRAFQTLHYKYPKSYWTKQTPYHY